MIVVINGEAGAPPRPRRLRDAPREGTDARLVYDLLREYAGRAVSAPDWTALAELLGGERARDALVGYLRHTYGLEVSGRTLLSEPGPRVYYA